MFITSLSSYFTERILINNKNNNKRLPDNSFYEEHYHRNTLKQ